MDVCWYTPNKDDYDDEKHRADQLIGETAQIEMRQRSWHELNLWNATLYTNRELPGFRWGNMEATTELWPTNLRTENIVESIGEAMLSKASGSPLKPSLVPHGRSWKVERAVRLLDSFLFGVWRQTEAENACVEMFRDAYMSGLGCVRVGFDPAKKAITTESVFFDNIIIDNRECNNRTPPRTVRIRTIQTRAAIEAAYGVELCPSTRYVDTRAVGEGYEPVIEAYRRPDAKGKGGRHTIACCGKLLVDEAWNHEWIPLVFFHWQDRTSGFFCKSGVEQVVPFQVIQNELNDDIRESQDIRCRPRMLLNANSMVDVEQWDNQAGRFLLWSGMKPEAFEWKTELSELYQERERNKAAAYSHMGLSEMTANADMPQQVRLDSSAGIREFRNMEDARHLRLWTNFEKARLLVAKTILMVLSISKGADAYKAAYHPGHSIPGKDTIEYAAVKTLTDDKYSWTMEATPLSAMSPAARREMVRDWASRQMGYTDDAKRMVGNPNIEWLEECEMASIDDIRRHISIMEDGGYEKPTEYTNTIAGVHLVTANLHRLKLYEDVEPVVFDNHVAWLVAATAIQQQATQPTATPFAPTQGMPGTNAALPS